MVGSSLYLAGASEVALAAASAGIIWTFAGLVLLLWGWLSLRSRSRNGTSEGRSRSRILRVGAGALIGAIAALAATVGLGEGPVIEAALELVIPPAISSFLAREASGLLVLFGGPPWSWIGIGFGRMGTDLAAGFVQIGRGLMFGAGYEAQYVVVNQLALGAAILTGGLVGWVSRSSRWRMAGVVTYLGVDLTALGFLALTLAVVESSTNGLVAALGITFVATLLFGFVLSVIYQFYALEHIAGDRSPAEVSRAEADAPYDGPWPFVLVQVASFNEPSEVVRECLRSIRGLDYPSDRFAVQLCDDSTEAETVRELDVICRELGVDFQHRTDRRGFKGGALNDGLHRFERPVDLVAIVDSDYLVEPAFLRRTVPLFRYPKVGFVQTPQGYRNVREGGVTRWYELADAYFYRVVQPVRARYQSLIFCGTMGVLRRAALEDAGGWSMECVTEDAELTMRLLAHQWEGRYLPENLGAGLAPDLMSAVRSQQRRWAFGGVQMLRLNRKLLLSRRMTIRQRFDFFTTGLFWFDGLFLVGIAGLIAGFVVASWFGIFLPFAAVPAPAIVAVAPVVMMVDGLAKIRAALRESRPVTFRDVIGVLTFWYAIKLNDLRAAIQALRGRKIPFARTPKIPQVDSSRWAAFKAAFRMSRVETSVALGLVGIAAASLVVWSVTGTFSGTGGVASAAVYSVFLAWLLYYAYAFASTFWFDYQSRLSLMSPRGRPEPTPPAPETA